MVIEVMVFQLGPSPHENHKLPTGGFNALSLKLPFQTKGSYPPRKKPFRSAGYFFSFFIFFLFFYYQSSVMIASKDMVTLLRSLKNCQ